MVVGGPCPQSGRGCSQGSRRPPRAVPRRARGAGGRPRNRQTRYRL